jgi:hypothetical protein
MMPIRRRAAERASEFVSSSKHRTTKKEPQEIFLWLSRRGGIPFVSLIYAVCILLPARTVAAALESLFLV